VVQYGRVCCSVLQCGAVRCSALQCVAVRCSALQCVAVRSSALQCVAVRCSALQCVAVRCSALQCVAKECCSVLQSAVAYCDRPAVGAMCWIRAKCACVGMFCKWQLHSAGPWLNVHVCGIVLCIYIYI